MELDAVQMAAKAQEARLGERALDVAGPAMGTAVSGATWFGFDVPTLIQHATLVLILLQIGWWVYKIATHKVEKSQPQEGE